MIELLSKEDCCGCSACTSVCPKKAVHLVADEQGFLYPLTNHEICINCNLCNQVCPIRQSSLAKNESTPIDIYAARHKRLDILKESSSGGVFTALAETIISEHGGVAGVQYSKDMNVEHSMAWKEENLQAFRGSKYVQSNLKDTYKIVKEHLKQNKTILFSGTPCQVAGLKLFLRKEYKNLITCDLICQCVSSPLVFKDYISYIEQKYRKQVKHINMREKTMGWKNSKHKILFTDGTSIFNEKDSWLWRRLNTSFLISRPSCSKCRFTTLTRTGDITIGDFWNVGMKHQDFANDLGVSIIFVNNEKGKILLKKAQKDLEYIQIEYGDDILQPHLLHPIIEHSQKDAFWEYYIKNGFEQSIHKYFHNHPIRKRAKQFLKKIKNIYDCRNRNIS